MTGMRASNLDNVAEECGSSKAVTVLVRGGNQMVRRQVLPFRSKNVSLRRPLASMVFLFSSGRNLAK